jgi:uncharacterized protein
MPEVLVGPIPIEKRSQLIDVVRGFALFGVLLANMVDVTQFMAMTPARLAALPTGAIDRVSYHLIGFFVKLKFQTIFSFLFGLGFALQLMRWESRNASGLPIYARRLLILLIIGVAHHVLLWYGDILAPYAALGFVLILFRGCRQRTLLAWALIFAIVLPSLTTAIPDSWFQPNVDAVDGPASAAREEQLAANRLAAFTHGSYGDVLRANASFWDDFSPVVYGSWLATILGKFLLGYAAGRRRLLQDAVANAALFRKILIWGVVGTMGYAAWVITRRLVDHGRLDETIPGEAAVQLATAIGVLAMSAAYVSAIALLFQKAGWRRRLASLAPVGRMPLTNYLMQTFVYLFLFYGLGPGLGLMGRVGASLCIPLSVAVFALQIALSTLWLRHFQFGPVEWVWRSLTYMKRQPMRLPASA